MPDAQTPTQQQLSRGEVWQKVGSAELQSQARYLGRERGVEEIHSQKSAPDICQAFQNSNRSPEAAPAPNICGHPRKYKKIFMHCKSRVTER